MKAAVMQPYIFPYIGYFQLVHAVDTFVFADDVNFIKGGWINRNRILLQNRVHIISFPCMKRSQNKMINEVSINMGSRAYANLLLTIQQAYGKAPYFGMVFPRVKSLFYKGYKNLSELASASVMETANYLELDTNFLFTSGNFGHTKGLEKSDRVIQITKELGSRDYINAIGGQGLYEKDYFKKGGVSLQFIKTGDIAYRQFQSGFIPNLSILDVVMFNSVADSKMLLDQFTLV